jgi:glycosyltransferase involved in cell wall biosynthesis
MRYAWNHYFSYFPGERLGPISRFLIPPIIHGIRLWDTISAHRVDRFIANSKTVAERIQKYYRRSAEIIHPPVDTEFFQPAELSPEYFLIVSALVPYKKIELAIEAFNRSGEQLKIVGQGPDIKRLKRLARPNIYFLGSLEARELLQVYQNAKALIMPGEEDFGINSLEAQACGIPVIAYRRGGATESVVAGETGIFFSELKSSSLIAALDKFRGMDFNKTKIRANAENFSRDKFKAKISSHFRRLWTEHKS